MNIPTTPQAVLSCPLAPEEPLSTLPDREAPLRGLRGRYATLGGFAINRRATTPAACGHDGNPAAPGYARPPGGRGAGAPRTPGPRHRPAAPGRPAALEAGVVGVPEDPLRLAPIASRRRPCRGR